MRTNRLPWLLSGALGASLSLAPALVAQQQGGATAQQTPTPGQQGDWGQAGPPPDAQNGQIPAAGQCGAGSEPECGPGPEPISRPSSESGPGADPISQPGATAPCPCGRTGSGLWAASAACLSAWAKPIQRLPGTSSRSSAGSATLRPRHLEQRYAVGDPHQ